MAETKKHPYISGSGAITQTINQLRSSIPAKIDADLLKKLGIASNNESYMINILRFIGVIDDDGNRKKEAQATFTKHNDAEFQKAFGDMVKVAYKDLFDIYPDAFNQSEDRLITYFRNTDQTSALVGSRQASTFLVLATFAGHGEIPTPKTTTSKPKEAKVKATKNGKGKVASANVSQPSVTMHRAQHEGNSNPNVGLTVRIEVNLPANGDQDTYDKIFRSIRENLLNAK